MMKLVGSSRSWAAAAARIRFSSVSEVARNSILPSRPASDADMAVSILD